ncbi:unnamed protein product [Tenebrio molitor]|nr:unnamed protein product [Tenebrio molitor]
MTVLCSASHIICFAQYSGFTIDNKTSKEYNRKLICITTEVFCLVSEN